MLISIARLVGHLEYASDISICSTDCIPDRSSLLLVGSLCQSPIGIRVLSWKPCCFTMTSSLVVPSLMTIDYSLLLFP
jgi:hypothetical protein